MGNNIAIITGGASGLGIELVKQFWEKGYFVCNIDRDAEKFKNYKSAENFKLYKKVIRRKQNG